MRFCILAACCILASTSALAQGWSGPFQLTNDTFADVNPSACPEWVTGTTTCLVWQTNRNGNWDIYAKFCTAMNGNGWSADDSVCTDSAEDVNPAVAACNDMYTDSAGFWCVWERRESPITGGIWSSFATLGQSWGAPVQVSGYIHTGGDSADPRVIVIGNFDVDTAWVTWTSHDTDGWHINYAYHAGDSWYGPSYAVNSPDPIRHARLGRGREDTGYDCPLLVWENEGDVYYSEYVDGSWQARQEVAHSDSLDRNPDIISHTWFPMHVGPWVCWESVRDGDTAIYGTAEDTFSVGRRWCDTTGAGNNRSPCGTPALYTTDYWNEFAAIAWVSDRTGNNDVYARTMFSDGDEYVDNNSANDINPTLTTMWLTQHWCVWQSDRSGNWDLFGGYIYAVGVEENNQPQATSLKPMPTIIRGMLHVPAWGFMRGASCVMLDISGRKVLDLAPGANDVSRLAPGVYFVRLDAGDCRATEKVVLQK
ncbi:T9SS type A sorting domain-containing protein [candidate division WOR-3 bacterium]|nr:T9SS type A sorting domain-containing protein [candidate division WOR-3 bacterium]